MRISADDDAYHDESQITMTFAFGSHPVRIGFASSSHPVRILLRAPRAFATTIFIMLIDFDGLSGEVCMVQTLLDDL